MLYHSSMLLLSFSLASLVIFLAAISVVFFTRRQEVWMSLASLIAATLAAFAVGLSLSKDDKIASQKANILVNEIAQLQTYFYQEKNYYASQEQLDRAIPGYQKKLEKFDGSVKFKRSSDRKQIEIDVTAETQTPIVDEKLRKKHLK